MNETKALAGSGVKDVTWNVLLQISFFILTFFFHSVNLITSILLKLLYSFSNGLLLKVIKN